LSTLRSRLAAIAGAIRNRPFDLRLFSRLTRREHVVVLGDSHAGIFDGWRTRTAWFKACLVGGATASGIQNPNSETRALAVFNERLAAVRPWQHVLVLLGEVDCGYIMWRRAAREGIPIDEQLDWTLERYLAFLTDVRRHRARSVMVMSASLPTLPDNSEDWGEIARRRADVSTTQRERTELTLRFNAELARRCAALGFVFVDAASAQLDPATGLIRDEFVGRGAGDHHLRDDPYRQAIVAALPF
jgi:hypothetical protein